MLDKPETIYFAQPINKFLGVEYSLIENWEAALQYAKKRWWEITDMGYICISPAIMTIPVAINQYDKRKDDRELWLAFDYGILRAVQDVVIVFDEQAFTMVKYIDKEVKSHYLKWHSVGCEQEYNFAKNMDIPTYRMADLHKYRDLDECNTLSSQIWNKSKESDTR